MITRILFALAWAAIVAALTAVSVSLWHAFTTNKDQS